MGRRWWKKRFVPGGYIPTLEIKQRECWKFWDSRCEFRVWFASQCATFQHQVNTLPVAPRLFNLRLKRIKSESTAGSLPTLVFDQEPVTDRRPHLPLHHLPTIASSKLSSNWLEDWSKTNDGEKDGRRRGSWLKTDHCFQANVFGSKIQSPSDVCFNLRLNGSSEPVFDRRPIFYLSYFSWSSTNLLLHDNIEDVRRR